MTDWCPRCAWSFQYIDGLPHTMCWDRRADLVAAQAILEAAGRGDRTGILLLGEIGDERAAPVLRVGLEHADPVVQAAALKGLGWSGIASDVALAARFLNAEVDKVREAARCTIAEIGGPGAADALVQASESLEGLELLQALEGMAWLRDSRALAGLRELVEVHFGNTPRNDFHGVAWALVRVGTAADRVRLRDLVLEAVGQFDPDNGSTFGAAQRLYGEYAHAMSLDFEDEAQDTKDALVALDATLAMKLGARSRSGRPSPPVVRPLGARVVPRRHMTRLDLAAPTGAEEPPAKFGGLPDWREAPAWPVDSSGKPLVFYGQLPIPGDRPQTAYIFVGEDDSWEPLGEGNAVVTQPGPPPHLQTVPLTDGPQLFDHVTEHPDRFRRRLRRVTTETFVSFEAGADPAEWTWPDAPPDGWSRDDPNDWNKVGGTPLFLQGEEWPPGDGWHFEFQFSAGATGADLGDGAECYGYIDGDGRAALLWQCH